MKFIKLAFQGSIFKDYTAAVYLYTEATCVNARAFHVTVYAFPQSPHVTYVMYLQCVQNNNRVAPTILSIHVSYLLMYILIDPSSQIGVRIYVFGVHYVYWILK